jgi:hypothetical protein
MLLWKFSIVLLFKTVLNLDMTQMVLMLEAQMNFVLMLLTTREHKETLFVMTTDIAVSAVSCTKFYNKLRIDNNLRTQYVSCSDVLCFGFKLLMYGSRMRTYVSIVFLALVPKLNKSS